MYNTMIVEDSKPILKNIIRQIQSIDKKLKIVETASDGKEALEKLRKNRIDILFTDIRMPFLDGLQLIEEAKKIYPSIQSVIISGYDDFDYAKQAINLKVNEYILKPVDAEELKNVIEKVIANIDLEINLKLEKELNMFIKNPLLSGNQYKITIDTYILSIIRIGLLKKGFDAINKPILDGFLKNIHFELDYWILETGYPCEAVILFNADKNKNSNLAIKHQELLEKLKNKYKQVNILLSSVLSDIYSLNGQYQKLSNNLSSLIVVGESKVFFANSKQTANLNILNEEALLLYNTFRFIIRNRQENSFRIELRKFIDRWIKNNYPAVFIQRFLTVIIEELNKSYYESDLDLVSDMSLKIDNLLWNCYSYDDIYLKVINYYTSLLNRSSENNSYSTNELIEKIDSFIKSKVYSSMTIDDIANYFKLSPSYISRLIKSKFSKSPIKYYMDLKMEEAKKLVLNNTEIRIKDISDSLGFSDQHYFSKVFKTYFGVSPSEYKNITHP